jgi:adenylyl-sulfate kinase
MKKIVWFSGLSGSGKSTIASIVADRIRHHSKPYVLDGDVLRDGLNKGLTFTDEDRKENLRRASHVANILASLNHPVLASFITPMDGHREMIKEITNCKFVWIDTPLEECERRDPKGLYEKVREGKIKNFTGIDSPYIPFENCFLRIDTTKLTADEAANLIIKKCNL